MSLPSTSARGTLAAAALGFVVVLLDVSVVNVALDALRQEFATDVAGLQWVINAYTLVFAALLLTSGALGDRLGARRIFLAGFLVFTVASAACRPERQPGDADRRPLGPGLGAALLVPNSLAMLQQAFPDREQRSRAVGWWGAFGGVSLAAGPVLGGMLVTHMGWRSIFLINLPIGLIGIHLTLRHVAAHGGARRRGLDWRGRARPSWHWPRLPWPDRSRPARLDARAGARLVGGGRRHPGLHLIEARGRSPMLPLELFKVSTFAVASLAGVIVNFAYYGLIFVFSLFFQVQQQLSPQLTGLAFLPMTIVLMAVNVLAGRLITRLGARVLMVLGWPGGGRLWLADAGQRGRQLLAAGRADADGGQRHRPDGADHDQRHAVIGGRLPAGIASGVLNSARQVGGMLGVAVFGYLLRDTEPQAFMRGMHLSIGIAVALLLAASALCWFRMGTERAVA